MLPSRQMHDDCLAAHEWLKAQHPDLAAAHEAARANKTGWMTGTPLHKFAQKLTALSDVAAAWALNERPFVKNSVSIARQVIREMKGQ